MFEEPDDELAHDWNLMWAAKFLGVRVWELAERPVYWLELAKIGMEYQMEQAERARRRYSRD